jgi:hypothetical protein
MKRMRRLTCAVLCQILIFNTLNVALCARADAGQKSDGPNTAMHAGTDWRVSPSFKFDALCFLNLLTGDPFYVRYYKDEYAEFAPRLTPAARAALIDLKRKIKDENKDIISAFLCMYFSATDDQTLEDMLRTVENSERMKGNLRRTVYYSDGGWKLYESVRADLRALLLFLKEINFKDHWERSVLQKVKPKVESIGKSLAGYDVVTQVETRLGFALPSDQITVYVLHYVKPHGIRITGARFIIDASYPFRVVLQNAVHEMLHPPYDLARDRELREALDTLKADLFLVDKIRNHNPSFGYNSFDGFVEEDCVRALDQIVGETLKVAGDARQRWKEEDDGIHVFAVALYSLMRQESFDQSRETCRAFLLRMIRSGKLSAGKIKPIYDEFYSQH